MPCVPWRAARWGWSLKARSDATLWSATSQTSPPAPPSPPSGPPFATWASRRNDTAPAPPSPPFTCRPASSMNWDIEERLRASLVSSEPMTASFGEAGRRLSYGSYLQVPELLSLQRTLTDAHDELLFIVV